jgi:hypothetical protein
MPDPPDVVAADALDPPAPALPALVTWPVPLAVVPEPRPPEPVPDALFVSSTRSPDEQQAVAAMSASASQRAGSCNVDVRWTMKVPLNAWVLDKGYPRTTVSEWLRFRQICTL